MKGTCPLADPNVAPVCLEIPDDRGVYTSGGVAEKKNPDGRSRCFQMVPDVDLELVLPQDEPPRGGEGQDTSQARHRHAIVAPDTPPIYAERSFTGHGAERGGVQTILTNPSPDAPVDFVYMESLPWFMRVYLHTLEARVGGASGPKRDDLVQEIVYRPALDRARGTQLELRMRIPPASTVFLTYDFEKSILRYTEYPPDANRGFDVAAAVITVFGPDGQGQERAVSSVRTTSLLLSLPTPDFSMPYNVIIFTSTAIALAFGGMFNILVRRFVAADEGPDANLRTMLLKVVGRMKALANRRGKLSSGEKTE